MPRVWTCLLAGIVLAGAGGCAARGVAKRPAPEAEAEPAPLERPEPEPVVERALPEMVELPAVQLGRGDAEAGPDAAPLPAETVERFYLDTTEVPAEAYEVCVRAGSCAAPRRGPLCTGGDADRARHPINCVRWTDAEAYCRFVGKRLPTEAEWERAARGAEGRRYVWGAELPPPPGAANLADAAAQRARPYWNVLAGYDDGFAETAPIDALRRGDRTPEGVVQLAGNVAEWVQDAYEPALARKTPAQRAALAAQKTARYRVVRGASFGEDRPLELRAARRQAFEPKIQSVHVGFRCARTTAPTL